MPAVDAVVAPVVASVMVLPFAVLTLLLPVALSVCVMLLPSTLLLLPVVGSVAVKLSTLMFFAKSKVIWLSTPAFTTTFPSVFA